MTAFKSGFPVVPTVLKIKLFIVLLDQTIAGVVFLLVSDLIGFTFAEQQ